MDDFNEPFEISLAPVDRDTSKMPSERGNQVVTPYDQITRLQGVFKTMSRWQRVSDVYITLKENIFSYRVLSEISKKF